MNTTIFIQKQFFQYYLTFFLTVFILSCAIAQISYDGNSKLCFNGKDTIPLAVAHFASESGESTLAHNEKMRIIAVDGVIEDQLANALQQLLLDLDNKAIDTITLIIRSIGGNANAGLAIYDVMVYIPSPVKTIAYDYCASAAALLLSSGEKGLRYASRSCNIMIHKAQPAHSGSDIAALLAQRLNKELVEILAYHTGQSIEKLTSDLQTDYWMTAREALDYGLIDSIID